MDTELRQQLRAGIDRVPAHLPPGLARQAYNRYRKRRLAAQAALTTGTAAVVAVAAIAVAAVTSPPQTLTTAYVVSHVTKALDSPAATTQIMFLHYTDNSQDIWSFGERGRVETFTRAGQPAVDQGTTSTATGYTWIEVDYGRRTWSAGKIASSGEATVVPAPHPACYPPDLVSSPAQTVAGIRKALACGELTAAGTGRVDGIDAIKLVSPRTTVPPPLPTARPTGLAIQVTLWVNPATYLPVRYQSVLYEGLARPSVYAVDIQWLPPTAADRAKLTVPVPPGFNRLKS